MQIKYIEEKKASHLFSYQLTYVPTYKHILLHIFWQHDCI